MKIMICGKGGCGKSTVTTLLAFALAEQNKEVLVIDGDESNYGLHRQLGVTLPKDFAQYYGGRRGIMGTEKGKAFITNTWKIADIPSEYLAEARGVKMMVIGKIEEAGEGCACAMGVLAKNFLPALELEENQIVIVDAEAGVEHFGRGVDHNVDAVIMILDPSFESVQLSDKIYRMAESIGKPVYFILNKVTKEQSEVVKQSISHPECVIGVIYANTEVLTKGLMGQQLDVTLPEVGDILKNLWSEKRG